MFIKICGITNAEDALLAAGLGADAVGMIFAASPRRITTGEARDIVRRLPPEVLPVGVFRNESKERVAETANALGVRAVQLHGSETPEETRWVAERVPIVIRAFAATDPALLNAEAYGASRLLIDSATPGSGQVFDWAVLEGAPADTPFILAGGLHPGNVADAIRTVRPWGIDVATGLEASPGRKDPAKVRRFMAAARAAQPSKARVHLDAAPAFGLRADTDTDPGADTNTDTGTKPGTGMGTPEPPFDWEADTTWR